MWNIALSTYRKNRIGIKRATPWSLIIYRIVEGFTSIALPFFIYRFFLHGAMTDDFHRYSGGADYITYVVLGLSLNVLAVSTLMNIGRALMTEMRQGTLEPLLLSPASRPGYFLGCLMEQTSRALLEFGAMLIFGFILGARLNLLFSFEAIFTILLAMFSFFCFGVFLSSIMLFTRDTFIVQNTLFTVMTLVCGVLFPIEFLPRFVQVIAQIFPLTPAVALFRNVAIAGMNLSDNLFLIAQILVTSVIFVIIGGKWLKRIEKSLVDKIFG